MARDATAKGLEHRVRISWSSRRYEISSEPSHRCRSWFWCVGRLSTLGAPRGSIRKSRVRCHGLESIGNALKDILPPVHFSRRKAFYSKSWTQTLSPESPCLAKDLSKKIWLGATIMHCRS